MAMSMESLIAKIAKMEERARLLEPSLRAAAGVVQTEAKRLLGTNDANWPELAEATQEKRISLGYPADEALKMSGILGDKITVEVDGKAAYVGVKSEMVQHPYAKEPEDIAIIARTHEYGNGHVPPRPYLSTAARRKHREIHDVFERSYGETLMGKNVGGDT
jgi:hypothetical protein